jgi:protein SCO1/2
MIAAHWRTVLLSAVCCLLAATYGRAESMVTAPAAGVSIDPQLGRQVPLELVFHDEAGRPVRLGELMDGRPVILNLLYFRCPMLCNMVVDGMIRALRALQFTVGDEFTVITVSIDPHEGPELASAAKQTALERYGRGDVGGGWYFLTGQERSIGELADAVGFGYRFDERTKQYAHGAGLFVLTPQGKLSRFFSGVEFAARDLRLGLIEAAESKIGTPADHVLLLCYQYDPTTGKYGLAIMNALRLAGTLTVLVIVVSVSVMIRRERLHRAPSHEPS